MRQLSKEEILGHDDRQIEEVRVPEWGGSVYVRSLTADERDEYEGSYLKEKSGRITLDRQHLRAKLVALAVCNDRGERLFDGNGDVEALGRKSAAAMDRLYEVAARLSGVRPADEEELLGNSAGAPA